MNEFDPSLDEIVSAYVDGVATADERARVEADPVLVARAATFRRVHDALAVPVPTDDARRRTLIARALADTAAPVATVHPLRRRRITTLGPIVAAAAVIAMFFGLGTWLVASQDNNDTSASTSAAAPSVAEDLFDAKGQLSPGATTPTAASAAGGASSATEQTAKAAPAYLGSFSDEPSLRQALDRARAAFGTTAGTAPPSRAVADAALCRRTDPPDATIYSADFRGRAVTIVVTNTRADLFDDATCAQTPLAPTTR